MPKFKALTPIEHNGKRYETDKQLDLSAEEAEPLLAVKAIEPVAAEKPGKGGKANKDDAGSGDNAGGEGSGA